MVRPAGAAEDTARRALMADGRALQSRQGEEIRERRIDRQCSGMATPRASSARMRHSNRAGASADG
ncbi:hypothetical protein PS273GM_00995 [Stutzerimonas stutzeri]|uniref:Uncharacterized protein n=1 Tax=Stutzerimonas stutzeri TaxID=316 RepID=A0A172WK35_STUST|nr:hypothetical protein PS273GM_00995 [Stutzerimonas stutzeri]